MDARTLAAQLGDVQVIDVREPFEWEAGHIDGAHHIPMNELAARIGEIDPQTPAVAVCFGGARSAYAARFLQSQGLQVDNLDGGLQRWVRQGLPLAAEGGEAPGRLIHDPPAQATKAPEGRALSPVGEGSKLTEGASPGDIPLESEKELAPGSLEPGLTPEMEELKNVFIEAVFAAQDRFGDQEPSEEEMRSFMKEWLVSKGRTPEEAEEILNR